MTTTPQIVIMTDVEVDRLTAAENGDGLGALLTDKGPLPLKVLDVQADLEGLVGEVTLTQSFVNTHAEPLEATYIFPLPDRAAVTSFRMEVAGRVVEGVLKERGHARREYDEAIQAGHRAAIAEEERPNVFTLRVGNLLAGEAATVRLTMVGPLVYDAGEVTFRFPLVVAPRYIPGNPLPGRSVGDGVTLDTDAVPDASRITPPVLLPGYPNPVRFSMAVNVQPGGLPVRDFRSSLHAVVNEQMTDGATRLAVQPGERLNRDFILRYQIGEETVKSSLTLVPDADSKSEEGTFAFTVVPPLGGQRSDVGGQKSRPRSVVFVLDRSGSMDGWKMVAARRALGRMIDSLTDRDRFTVLAFDDETETPALCEGGLLSASDRHRFRVIEWLANINARGGTELAQPLELAISQLAAEAATHAERVLVLVTDGQVGNEDQILQALARRLQGIRIFTLGIDRAVNEAFLRRLAALGGGSCDVVESEDRLDEVMDKVQRRICTPVLTGLAIQATGLAIEADSQVPARLPDLFAGVPLTIMGRYRGAPGGTLVLTAKDDAGRQVTQNIEARVSSSRALTKLWARQLLRDQEDRWVIATYEAQSQLREKIVALSLKFGVLCRFTAFVAVDLSATANQGGKLQHLVQPVELVEGWTVPQSAPAGGLGQVFAASAKCYAPMMRASLAMPEEIQEEIEELCEFSIMEDSPEDQLQDSDGSEQMSFVPAVESPPPYSAFADGDDLAAYRERAREILEEFKADADLGHALGVLATRLEALLEDIKSTGANPEVMDPLQSLLEEIRAALGTMSGGQLEKTAQAWTPSVERQLTAFAEGAQVS